MNWDAIGAIGEIIAALGVVVSLVYLARQIQTNTKSTAVGATSAYLQGYSDLNSILMDNRDFAKTFFEGYYSYDELDGVEKSQYHVAMWQWFYFWDSMFTLEREGLLPKARWEAIRSQIRHSLAMPGPRAVWEAEGKLLINSELVAEIESWPAVESSMLVQWMKPPDGNRP